jgi:hypothetical protein
MSQHFSVDWAWGETLGEEVGEAFPFPYWRQTSPGARGGWWEMGEPWAMSVGWSIIVLCIHVMHTSLNLW